MNFSYFSDLIGTICDSTFNISLLSNSPQIPNLKLYYQATRINLLKDWLTNNAENASIQQSEDWPVGETREQDPPPYKNDNTPINAILSV